MTATLASALVAAQAEMPAVQPDSVNPHFGSRFVSLGHLIAKTKPVLTKHGLAIVQEPASIDGQPALTTTLLHAESGEQKSSTAPLILQKQDMQGLGGALTYMRRYAWAAVLGISDEEDDDGNHASAPQAPAAAQRAQETQPAAADIDGWTWPSGKHQGKTLDETDRSYIEWYADSGPKADVKQRCRDFLNGDQWVESPDDDIPFLATVDGLGN